MKKAITNVYELTIFLITKFTERALRVQQLYSHLMIPALTGKPAERALQHGFDRALALFAKRE